MTAVDAIAAELEKPIGNCPCAGRANMQRAAAARLLLAQQAQVVALTTLTKDQLIDALGKLAAAYEETTTDPCTCGGAADPTWPGARCAWCVATELLQPLKQEGPQCLPQPA